MILKTDELVQLQKAVIEPIHWPRARQKNISVSVLRTDKIHAIISGNKWFKLKYNIQKAIESGNNRIVTFGGAWSNHLVATAFLCDAVGLKSTGFIRGEEPEIYSGSLMDAEHYKMELRFISRESYKERSKLYESIQQEYPGCLIVEEGGQNEDGIRGASEIMELIPKNQYSHIACAVGTGTMMAGIIRASGLDQHVIGIPVLKMKNGENSIELFIKSACAFHINYSFFYDYHFGGYAKFKKELIDFMNQLYRENQIPSDIVYTAKLFFGVHDLIIKDHFAEGSNILFIHSGGLQGNRSLSHGMLTY